MHIAVLAKVVPDYEVPAGDFELFEGRAHSRYKRMLGLYDENAVELGAQLKEKYNAELSIVSYGSEDDVTILRKALAMGGDRLLLVKGDGDDPLKIAANLGMALKQLGNVDIILAGQQSADMDRGVVHGMVAQLMAVPFLPQISQVEYQGGQLSVVQMTQNGLVRLQLSAPCVLSVTSVPENVPRIPAVKAIFGAKKKPVEKLDAIESDPMGMDEIRIEIPVIESVCEFVPTDDLEQAAKMLMAKLREERYL